MAENRWGEACPPCSVAQRLCTQATVKSNLGGLLECFRTLCASPIEEDPPLGMGLGGIDRRRAASELACRVARPWACEASPVRHALLLLSPLASKTPAATSLVPSLSLSAQAGIEAGALPKNSLFRLKTHFDKAGEPWVFTGEVIGTLYIIVCTVASLGSHLKAFKPERAALLEAKAVPTIRVLREAEQLVSEETEEEGKAAEAELREACLGRVMGALMQTDTFEVEVEAIVKDAQKESHETYKGTIPDFMQTFLEEMQESAKKARTEASRDLREAANLLREEVRAPRGEPELAGLPGAGAGSAGGAGSRSRSPRPAREVGGRSDGLGVARRRPPLHRRVLLGRTAERRATPPSRESTRGFVEASDGSGPSGAGAAHAGRRHLRRAYGSGHLRAPSGHQRGAKSPKPVCELAWRVFEAGGRVDFLTARGVSQTKREPGGHG